MYTFLVYYFRSFFTENLFRDQFCCCYYWLFISWKKREREWRELGSRAKTKKKSMKKRKYIWSASKNKKICFCFSEKRFFHNVNFLFRIIFCDQKKKQNTKKKCNERLQQLFIAATLKKEQAEYSVEGKNKTQNSKK